MQDRQYSQAGSAIMVIFVTLVVAVAFAGVGIYVAMHQAKKPSNAAAPPAAAPLAPKAKTATAAPTAKNTQYEGMAKYTNDKYGFSFYFPADWRAVELDPPGQATLDQNVVLALRLRIGPDSTPTEQAGIEVSNRDFASAIAFRDSLMGDGGKPAKQVFDKTPLTIDGKDAYRYRIPQQANVDRIWYVIDDGSRTFSIETFNEESNLSRSADYLSNFENIVDSLKLQ